MEKLVNKTTREFYERFDLLKQELGVSFANVAKPLGYYPEQLRDLFKQDPHLNNIPLKFFDNYAYIYIQRFPRKGLSVSDGVCLVKHCLIYEVIQATPEFVDNYGFREKTT